MHVNFHQDRLPQGAVVRVKPRSNAILFETLASGFSHTIYEQMLGNREISFTRYLDWSNVQDRKILCAEAKGFGIELKKERDLKKLAQAYKKPRIMIHLLDSDGDSVMLERRVRAACGYSRGLTRNPNNSFEPEWPVQGEE